MRHLVYLMFRCDVDVMESLELGGVFWELNTALVESLDAGGAGCGLPVACPHMPQSHMQAQAAALTRPPISAGFAATRMATCYHRVLFALNTEAPSSEFR